MSFLNHACDSTLSFDSLCICPQNFLRSDESNVHRYCAHLQLSFCWTFSVICFIQFILIFWYIDTFIYSIYGFIGSHPSDVHFDYQQFSSNKIHQTQTILRQTYQPLALCSHRIFFSNLKLPQLSNGEFSVTFGDIRNGRWLTIWIDSV